jgi:hypothetical protein
MRKKVIGIRKVRDDYGWMGNMGICELMYDGKKYKSCEGIFVILRFNDEEIKEYLRKEDNGGMRVKMLSKKYKNKMVVERCSEKDVENMEEVIRLKMDSYSWIKDELRRLKNRYDEVFIYEDVSKRKRGNNLFWGGYFDENGEFVGKNLMGVIWMKIMDEI